MFHETQTKKIQHKLESKQHSPKEIPAHHKPQVKESKSEGKMKRTMKSQALIDRTHLQKEVKKERQK